MRAFFFAWIGILSVLALCPAQASEKIISFHDSVIVSADSTLTVTETITAQSEGLKIRRGIYRDFPTQYLDRYGNHITVGFKVTRVSRDDLPEDFHVEKQNNGTRVYIGKNNRPLPPGKHTYTLRYETDRQIGFFKDHDELYWNVTGNGWEFPIDEAVGEIILPPGTSEKVMETSAFTGPSGAKGAAYQVSKSPLGTIIFKTTLPLREREGLTIVVTWPKGFVKEPDFWFKFRAFVRDNPAVVNGFWALIFILFYYVLAWIQVGRDPKPDSIMPRYEPPKGLSPAGAGFITRMGYDHKDLTACLVNLAVKGHLTLKEVDGDYTLTRTRAAGLDLSAEETAVFKTLLPGSISEIALDQKNYAEIEIAISKIKDSLKSQHESLYFINNLGYFLAGAGLSFAAALWVGNSFSIEFVNDQILIMGLCLIIWGIAVSHMIFQIYYQARNAVFKNGIKAAFNFVSLFLTASLLLFIGGYFLKILSNFSLGYAAFILLLSFSNYLFYHLLKAPTLAGRKILDQIEGFKMFLEATEEDKFARLNPSGRTPELFEKYLPFAIALGIERAWAGQFTEIFSLASASAGRPYHPGWYTGRSWNPGSPGIFASNLGSSVSSAIASSSVPPG